MAQTQTHATKVARSAEVAAATAPAGAASSCTWHWLPEAHATGVECHLVLRSAATRCRAVDTFHLARVQVGGDEVGLAERHAPLGPLHPQTSRENLKKSELGIHPPPPFAYFFCDKNHLCHDKMLSFIQSCLILLVMVNSYEKLIGR